MKNDYLGNVHIPATPCLLWNPCWDMDLYINIIQVSVLNIGT